MTQWIAETLVATTLLMLLVLAIRPLVSDRFGARAAYLLWLGPALRMILPPLPAEWFGENGAAVQDVVVVLAGSSSPSLQPATATGGGTVWLIASLSIWLGGAVLFFGRHWLSYLRFSRDAAEDSRALFDAGNILVTASPSVSSPIALGVFGKFVIVPADFEHRYDAAEQRLAVAHELTHHDRHDVPVNFAALAVLSLHWWNPVAHIAHRAFRLDQEAACDAIVLHGATADERHAYGSALFKSAMGRVPLAACAMGATTTLKERLRRIVSGPVEGRVARPGAAFAALLVLGGVAITASGAVPKMVEPAAKMPRALVLGGAIIDAAEPARLSAPVAPLVHDEKNCPDARAHALAATASARASRIATAAHREARAEALEVAAAAQDAASEARAASHEALADLGDSIREAEAEAAIAMRSTEIARAVAIRSMKVSCSDASRGSVVSVAHAEGGQGQKQLRIVVCGGDTNKTRAHVIEALRTARAQIEGDAMLSAQARAHILAALDRQLAAIRPLPASSLQ